ncbi:unnamed protein product, partial [Ixodes pacificus]
MSSITNDESLTGARRSYEGTPLQITTMPDLTSTLPTYSGTDTESLTEWIASLGSMRERCSWSDMAMLSAGISRLRGRAAAWHRTEGTAIKEWADWLTALKNEFDKKPLFCQWVTSVNARSQKHNEAMTDYMYARLQLIKRGKYALTDDDIVDWLIQGVRSEQAKPMLAAFHDLRKGTVSDFLSYARQLDRRNVGKDESQQKPTTHATTTPHLSSPKTATAPARLTPDTCARCKTRGHRAKDCAQPDTRTEEERAAAARRREAKQPTSERVNNIITAHHADRNSTILLPSHVNSIEAIALWDTGSAVTLMSESFAASHNFEVTPDPDCVLGGPFGESRHPVGITQAKIAIGNASATIQAKVVKDLPHQLMVGLDWRQSVPYYYIERFENGVHSLEWIPKSCNRGQ